MMAMMIAFLFAFQQFFIRRFETKYPKTMTLFHIDIGHPTCPLAEVSLLDFLHKIHLSFP